MAKPMGIVPYINRIKQLYGSESLAPWDKPQTPWWEEKHDPGPWDEQQVASSTFVPESESMPNWRDLIREEGVQVGPQVKDGGRIYDTRKYFKPGGLVEPGVTHYGKKDYKTTEARRESQARYREKNPYIKKGYPETKIFPQREKNRLITSFLEEQIKAGKI